MAELFAQIACAMPRELAAKSLGWQDRAVYTEAIYYGRENLTDGVIDRGTLAFWMPDMPVKERVRRLDALRDRGALLEHPDGWTFPDHVWRKWGKTKAQVDDMREKEAERKKKYRDKNKDATDASENVPTGRDVTATPCPNESEIEIQPQPEIHPEIHPHPVPSSSQHNSHPQTGTDDDRAYAALEALADMLTTKLCDSAKPKVRANYRNTVLNDPEHLPALRLLAEARPFSTAEDLAEAYEDGDRDEPLLGSGSSRHPAWCECEGNHVVMRAAGYVSCPHTSWDHLPDATVHPLRGVS